MLNTKNCHIFVDMEFNLEQTIKTVFLDEGLKSIFTEEYNVTEREATDLLTPEMKDMFINIFNEIIDKSPSLSMAYKSNGSPTQIKTTKPTVVSEKERLGKITKPTTKRKTRKKRLSNKELDERTKIRGFTTDNDVAIYDINSLEKIITKVQRRGRKELFNIIESKAISKLVNDFERSISNLLDKNEKRIEKS